METGPRSVQNEESARPKIALEEVRTPEEFLDAIDWKELNAIFDLLDTRSGKEPSKQAWVGKDAVSIDMTPMNLEMRANEGGNSNRNDSTLTIRWDSGNDFENPIPLVPLHILIHEVTHLRSRRFLVEDHDLPEIPQRIPRFTDSSASFIPVRRDEGLHELIKDTEGNLHHLGVSLDEAVTEEIAVEVLQEYLRRTGNTGLLRDPQSEFIGTRSYTGDRVILATTIDGLAQRLSVSREEIWRSIVSTYLAGEESTLRFLESIVTELEKDPRANSLLAAELLERPHIDPREVISLVQNREALQEAVKRTLNRFKPEFLHDTLKLR